MNFTRLATSCVKLSHSAVIQSEARLLKAGLKTTCAPQNIKGTVHPGYQKIKAKYEKFQVDDGIPVHLKGGVFDYFLYCVTIAACGFGLYGTLDYIYHSSFPKKA